MKKILLAVLAILLLVLTYVLLFNSISIGNFKIESISGIKNASKNLEQDENKANNLIDETYPKEMTSLEETIKSLKIAKQKYEAKKIYNTDENELQTIQIDTYKIHFLWTRLGNYRKDRGVKSLNLDLKSTQTSDVYDLEFTLIGTYSSIIEFLYDIEDDEEINFDPKDFKITSQVIETQQSTTNTVENNTINNKTNNTNTNNSVETENDGINLKATFTVKNVGITLD